VHEWTAIVNANDRRAAVAAVDDGHFRPERQRAMGRRHGARVHVLSARSMLSAVNRGYARTLERSPDLGRTLFRLTQRRQRILAPRAVLAAQGAYFTGPVGVVSSDSPRQRVVRMRGSGTNIASCRQPRGHSACDKHVSKDRPITRCAVIFQNKFLPLHGLSVGQWLSENFSPDTNFRTHHSFRCNPADRMRVEFDAEPPGLQVIRHSPLGALTRLHQLREVVTPRY
jgi:hypothetical protein